MPTSEQALLDRTHTNSKSRERFQVSSPSCILLSCLKEATLTPKCVGLFQMKRFVIPSPRLHLLNLFLGKLFHLSVVSVSWTCHKGQKFPRTMLTPEYSCRNSWIGTELLHCRRLFCKCWVAPIIWDTCCSVACIPDAYLMYVHHLGNVGLKALSIMSPSNISSAGGPRLVRTTMLLMSVLLHIVNGSNYPTPMAESVTFTIADVS